MVSKRVVWRMFPRNENRNEGTFACSPGTKTRMRAHSPKPPFYETALLSPGEKLEKIFKMGAASKNKSKKPWVLCRRAGIDAALVRVQFVLRGWKIAAF